uniref:Ubiquitin-like protease family profile domain-containing protein n=1 Tax=Acrobeloides nanus TaxID=290746 RepID=A0A914DE92_9BILA
MPPPTVIPTKRRRRTALDLLAGNVQGMLETPRSSNLQFVEDSPIDAENMSTVSSTPTASTISNLDDLPRPPHWNDFNFAELQFAVNNEGEEVLELFRETENFFDLWTPTLDASLFFRMRLDDQEMASVRQSGQRLFDTVIFQYMLYIAREALSRPNPLRVAVLHPVFSSYFEPNRHLFQERPEYEPTARELLYGNRLNFEILLIPIQQQRNDHWTLAIYDKRIQPNGRFNFFDTLHNRHEEWHKNMIDRIRDTALLRNKKLKGRLYPVGTRSYNQQQDGTHCGHHICFIAMKYIFNDTNVYAPNFNPAAFRDDICHVLEPVCEYFRNSGEQIQPAILQQESVPVYEDQVSSDTESTTSNVSILRRSTRSRTSTILHYSSTDTPRSLSDKYQAWYQRKTDRIRHQDHRDSPENREARKEGRRKKKFDKNSVNPAKCIGPIEYGRNEGIARNSLGYFPEYYDSGNFDNICPSCAAKLLRNETYNLCCNVGSIELPLIPSEKEGYLGEVMRTSHPDHSAFIKNLFQFMKIK